MVAVGLVLLVLSALLAAGIVLSNGESVDAEAFGVSLDNVSVGGLFLVGLIVGIIAMAGLALMLVGGSRRRTKRVAVKREVQGVRGEKETLAEENARLQAELERSSTTTGPSRPATGGVRSTTDPDGPTRPAAAPDARTDTDADASGRHRA